jgi:predicted GNAT family acetyltransferase
MSGKKALPKDADLANVEKALKRSAKTARLLAEKTHTPCYVVKDGKIVNVAESQAEYRPAQRKVGSAGSD